MMVYDVYYIESGRKTYAAAPHCSGWGRRGMRGSSPSSLPLHRSCYNQPSRVADPEFMTLERNGHLLIIKAVGIHFLYAWEPHRMISDIPRYRLLV